MIGLRRMATGTVACITLFAAMTSTAGAASFIRQSPGVVTASAHSATAPGGGGIASVKFQIAVGPDETGSIALCQNGDLVAGPDGEPECPGLGSNISAPDGRSGEAEAVLKAGKYAAQGITRTQSGGMSVQQLESFEVVDECGFTVKAAVGIGSPGVLARPGDWYPCGGFTQFATGTPAPLAQSLDLESTVDRTRISIDGPGTITLAPGRVGNSGDLNMFVRQENEGRIDLNTRRRFSKAWTIVTPAAQTSLIDRKSPAKLRSTTTNGGARTIVKNLASARVSVSTFGRGGAGSIPTNLLPRAQCIKLRKYTVVLRRGQSTTVRKNKPPSGGEAFARRSCRR